MKRELASKLIFDDFVSKTYLNELEQDILIRYIKNRSIIQIAEEVTQSTATVSRIIARLKVKYNNYKKLEISKLSILNDE